MARFLRSEKMGVPATGRHLVNVLQQSAPEVNCLRTGLSAVWPFVFPLAPFFAKSESDQVWRRSLLCSEWPLASSQLRRARMLPWAKAILESAAP